MCDDGVVRGREGNRFNVERIGRVYARGAGELEQGDNEGVVVAGRRESGENDALVSETRMAVEINLTHGKTEAKRELLDEVRMPTSKKSSSSPERWDVVVDAKTYAIGYSSNSPARGMSTSGEEVSRGGSTRTESSTCSLGFGLFGLGERVR